jgi:hypothetical protein
MRTLDAFDVLAQLRSAAWSECTSTQCFDELVPLPPVPSTDALPFAFLPLVAVSIVLALAWTRNASSVHAIKK